MAFLLGMKYGQLGALIIGIITFIGVSVILIRFHTKLRRK